MTHPVERLFQNPSECHKVIVLIDLWIDLWRKPFTEQHIVAILKETQSFLRQADRKEVGKVLDAAIKALGDDRSVDILLTKLSDPRSRYLAAALLGWFAQRAHGAIPDLIDIVGSPSVACGAAKRSALLIGVKEQELMLAIRTSISDNDDNAFRDLCDLAMQAGYGNTTSFRKLLGVAAQSDDADMRTEALDMIGKLALLDN